ncbi:DUF7544 domain-containing protein [Candidatus Korobacter versatilis]|nr:hypothetical protein [Candidatus Koribacter versatilis]
MFKRFRFAFWLRMAVLGFFTAEMSSGGGGLGNFPTNFPDKSSGRHAGTQMPGHLAWFTPTHILELALAVAIFVVVLTLIILYINSRLRFVLFDAVLQGDTRLGEGWRKWRDAGQRYFAWQILLTVISWMLLILCLGLPAALLYSGHHLGVWHIDALGIATLVVAGLFYLLLAVVLGIVMVLAKDFVVPIMALENVGWQDGWRKFFEIARGQASDYVVYFLMKIVLRIGAGIVQGIIGVFVMLILIVPAVLAVIAGVAIGVGATMVVKAMLITAGIIGLLIMVFLMIAVSALIGAPVSFFFPSYAIYFFAGRYERLGRIVFPPPPPPPAPPAPIVPEPMPEPPPLPA